MDNQDNRKFPRVKRSLPVVYANLAIRDGAAYRYHRTALIDLSESGVGLTISGMIESKDLIQIILTLPMKPYIVTGLAEVVWVKPLPGGAQRRAGLRFIQCPYDLTSALLTELG